MWEAGTYRPFTSELLDAAPIDDKRFDSVRIDRVMPDVALMLRPDIRCGSARELAVFFDRPMAFLYLEETLSLDPYMRLERTSYGGAFPIYVCEKSKWMTDDEVLEPTREHLTHWAIVTLNDTIHVLSSDRIGLQWQGGEAAGFYGDGTPLN